MGVGLMLRLSSFYIFLVFTFIISLTAEASQVDFSWSMPKNVMYKKDSVEKRYIVWFYSIRNTTDKKILVPIEAFLSTDTEKNYKDNYISEIVSMVSEEGEYYMHSEEMKGEFLPGETKKGVAIFEDVDSYAQKVNIFATGLSHFFFWRWRLVDYSYRITFKKSGDKWILGVHGFSKDCTHRDFADKFK